MTIFRLITAIGCMLALTLLPGCYHRAADEKIAEITVWHGYKPSVTPIISASLSEFRKKNRGVSFTVRSINPDRIIARCLRDIPEGTGPDLILIPSQMLQPLREKRVITSLDYWRKKSGKAYAEAGWKLGQRGSHYYGIPFALRGTAFVYNHNLVEKPPANTKDMLEEITSAVELSKTGIVFPLKEPYYSLSFYMAQNPNGLKKIGILPTALYYQLLLDIATLQPNVTAEDYASEANVLDDLVSGKAEMGILSDRGIWTLSSSAGDFRAASFPRFSGVSYRSKPVCTGDLVVVSALAENKELAGQVAVHLTSDRSSLGKLIREIEGIPARKSLYRVPPFDSYLFKGTFRNLRDAYPVSDPSVLDRLLSPLKAGIMLTLNKEMSPTGAATEANVRFNVAGQ